jgi:hypothetical protein
MGLLDEAIREHLELKRRRGADPTEVERLEREALGPVRRVTHGETDVLLDEGPLAGTALHDEEASGDSFDPLQPAEPFGHGPEQATGQDSRLAEHDLGLEPPTELHYPDEPAPAPERGYEPPRHHEIAEEWEAHQQEPLRTDGAGAEPDEPAPTMPPPTPTAPPPSNEPPPETLDETAHVEQETAEYDVAGEHVKEPHPDDVLEETPEFLQDTPDHDRLWFEQRPPRDFDLDG